MVRYNRFHIEKYKAIKDSFVSVLNEPVPLIGVNESGKSSVLEAVARFDYRNDTIADQKKWKFFNRYMPDEKIFSVVAEIAVDSSADIETIIGVYPDTEKEEIMAAIQVTAENKKFLCKRILEKTEAGSSVKYSIGEKESPVIEKFSKDLVAQLPVSFISIISLKTNFQTRLNFHRRISVVQTLFLLNINQ
jgi:hypothetical protein